MIFEIAFILVAIGIFSFTWAILEILALNIYIGRYQKPNRSKSVRKPFDK